MKKIVILSLVFVVSALHCDAQVLVNYLVNFAETQADAYNGDAEAAFGISGPVTFVGGNSPLTYGGNSYTLGSALLTWNSPSYLNIDGAGAVQSDPTRLTGTYAFNAGSLGTFTLSGFNTGDTINIQAIGSQDALREGILTVTLGATNLGSATIAAATGLGGTGTFTQVSNFVAGSGASYTLSFDRAVGQAEANFSGLLISVTPVPEPSSLLLALGGLGFAILLFKNQKRKVVS